MYVIIIALIGVSSAIYGIKTKKIYHPCVVFNAFWTIIAVLANMNLFNMLKANKEIYFYIMLGIIFFDLGTSIVRKNKIQLLCKKIEKRKEAFWFLIIVSTIILIFTSSQSIKYLLKGYSMSDIRYLLQEKILENKMIHRGYKFIAVPFGLTLMPLWSWEILTKKNKNFFFLFFVPFYQLLCFLTEAATRQIYNFLITFFFCGVINICRKNIIIRLSKKTKRVFLCFLGLIILTFVIMRIIRGRTIGMAEHLYTYFTCGIPFFSIKLDEQNLFMVKTYGISSIQGIIRPFMGVLEIFGIESTIFNEASDFILGLQNNAVLLTPKKYYNFFSTCFAYFYKDFGVSGVAFFSFIWGCFEKKLYIQLMNDLNVRTISLYLLGIVSIFLGMMNFFGSESETVWAFIYLLLITKKTGKVHVNENMFSYRNANEKY